MIPGTHRFHGHASLGQVYKHGRVVRGPQITLKYSLNPRRRSYRLAVVVSKKVEKTAVGRNRIRRRIYEVVRKSAVITDPYDLVFTVFSDQIATMEAANLERLIINQLKKAGVISSVNHGSRGIVKTKHTE